MKSTGSFITAGFLGKNLLKGEINSCEFSVGVFTNLISNGFTNPATESKFTNPQKIFFS